MSAAENQDRLEKVLRRSPVVPVLTLESVEAAVPTGRALFEGGLDVIEVTLRTPAALEAARAMAQALPELSVGAGTVLTDEQMTAVAEAGLAFAVSPGFTPRLVASAAKHHLPYLPAAATPAEALQLLELGHRLQKFFPAEAAGGVTYLKQLGAPLARIGFCPSGGIDAAKAADYLKLPNVVVVEGSWMATPALIAAERWEEITALAKEAAALARTG